MLYRITEIEGIAKTFKAKLAKAEIKTTDDLLKAGATRKGRKELSKKTGLKEGQLLKWANMADLLRVKGVGKQYAELLEASGVDTVKELKARKADNLAAKMADVNKKKKKCKAVPAPSVVARWVKSAKSMKPKVSH